MGTNTQAYINQLNKNPTVKCNDCGGYITPMNFNANGICIKCLSKRVRAYIDNGGNIKDIANMAKGRFITN